MDLLIDLIEKGKIQKKVITQLEKTVITYQRNSPEFYDAIVNKIKLFSKIQEKITNFSEGNLKNDWVNWVSEETKRLQTQKDHYGILFPSQLSKILNNHNLKLEGSLPNLHCSFYRINVDVNKNKCSLFYGPQKVVIKKFKLDPKLIGDYLNNYNVKIEKELIDPNIFLDIIDSSYHKSLNKNVIRTDKKIRLLELYEEVKKSIKPGREMTQMEFSYNLYRFKNVRGLKKSIILSTATRFQVNARDFIWVPSDENPRAGTFYSLLEVVNN